MMTKRDELKKELNRLRMQIKIYSMKGYSAEKMIAERQLEEVKQKYAKLQREQIDAERGKQK